MKAAVLYEYNKPIEIKDIQQDPPKSGEVLVKMGVAGICASDDHILRGQISLMPLPVVLGHEGAGTVIEVGAGVRNVKPGDRCILAYVSHCGNCRPCRTGTLQICETYRSTGGAQFDGTYRLHDGDTDILQLAKLGVFAEYAVVPAQACHIIPDSVPFEVGALVGCSVTTGIGAVINNPNAQAGMTVAVFGCGGVGLNVIQGARLLNASKIIAVDILNHKLEFTYKFGATHVLNAKEVNIPEAIKEITDGGVDMAFDSFGGAIPTADALASVRNAGTAVVIGLAPDGVTAPIDMIDLVRGQKTLMGSFYGSTSPHETFDKLLDFYLKGKIDVEGLVTRRYHLDDINKGFDGFINGEDGRGIIPFEA